MIDNPTNTGSCTTNPAPQPHGQEQEKCTKPPYEKKAPQITPDPVNCKQKCTCPPTGKAKDDPDCLEDLIADQSMRASLGEEAKKTKSELEEIKGKLTKALEKYTPEAHEGLLKRWKDNDKLLKDLIRKLVCNIPCWSCVIECEICPLINAITADERLLNGTNVPYTTANSLYDQRYWWESEKRFQQGAFDRVSKVMAAWQDPFTTIDGVLKTIATDAGAASSGKMLGPELNKLVFETFFRFVPLHLAIAPSKDIAVTEIDKKYVEFCSCDEPGEPDACCGPNIGPQTVRERLVGPQPYLIAPNLYPALICCLATGAYQPAKAAYAAASAALKVAEAQIEAKSASIAARLKSLPADAKINLGKAIDCNGKFYQPKDSGCNCD